MKTADKKAYQKQYYETTVKEKIRADKRALNKNKQLKEYLINETEGDMAMFITISLIILILFLTLIRFRVWYLNRPKLVKKVGSRRLYVKWSAESRRKARRFKK